MLHLLGDLEINASFGRLRTMHERSLVLPGSNTSSNLSRYVPVAQPRQLNRKGGKSSPFASPELNCGRIHDPTTEGNNPAILT